jgi:hypothetical protein
MRLCHLVSSCGELLKFKIQERKNNKEHERVLLAMIYFSAFSLPACHLSSTSPPFRSHSSAQMSDRRATTNAFPPTSPFGSMSPTCSLHGGVKLHSSTLNTNLPAIPNGNRDAAQSGGFHIRLWSHRSRSSYIRPRWFLASCWRLPTSCSWLPGSWWSLPGSCS